jgi:hypothetical protein
MRCGVVAALALSACSLFPDLGGLTGDAGANESSTDAAVTGYARTISITNNAQAALPAGYTIGVSFPDADLGAAVAAGKIRADYGDLRVVGASGERDRMIDDPPLARVVWFSLAAPIAPGATDTSYAITYGDPSASNPPANGANVFDVYDDFTATTLDARWLTINPLTPSNGTITLRTNASDAVTTAEPLDPQTTLELRAQVTNPSSGDGGGDDDYSYWLGFQHTGDFDADVPWVLWLSQYIGTISADEQADGCTNGCNGPNLPQTSAFRIYGIERAPNQSIFSCDGAVEYTIDDAVNDQSLSIMLRSYLVASDVVIDWVRSHVRVYPEPTVTLGAEQSR